MTPTDAAARAPARLEQVTLVAVSVVLAAALAAEAVAVLQVTAVMAVPAALVEGACVIRDARCEPRLRFDALALACSAGLALVATAAGDDAASLLGYVIIGAALGLLAGTWWAVYLAVLLSLGLGLWGLLVSVMFVPSVIAGVVARPH